MASTDMLHGAQLGSTKPFGQMTRSPSSDVPLSNFNLNFNLNLIGDVPHFDPPF